MRTYRVNVVVLSVLVVCTLGLQTAAVSGTDGRGDRSRVHEVVIPEEDRFTPYALTIHPGDTVKWINKDTDDHTVVSDDSFTTTDHRGTDSLLPGTDKTGGTPSTFTLRFSRPGTFVYYCRFHAKLDGDNQPVAPGPEGGIQDAKGNFGTPMTGVITVLPKGGD